MPESGKDNPDTLPVLSWCLSFCLILLFLTTGCGGNHYELHSAEMSCKIEARQDLYPACERYLEKNALDPFLVDQTPALESLEGAWLANCVRYFYQESQCAGRKGLKIIKVKGP